MQNYTNGAASAAPPEHLKNYAFMMNAYGYNPWMTPWLQSTVHGPYESPAVMDAVENNVISNSSLSSNSSGDPPTSSQNSPPLKSSIDLTNLSFAGNSSASLYNNYLNPEINSLFNQTINPVPLLASALPAATTTAAPGRMLSRTTRTAASSRPSTARACECPNCVEFQRRGVPSNVRNEKHNCHIPGCHKVYARSSHLKAHLRWHTNARPPPRRTIAE